MTDTDGAVTMPIEELGIDAELRLKDRAIDEAPVGITISDPAEPRTTPSSTSTTRSSR